MVRLIIKLHVRTGSLPNKHQGVLVSSSQRLQELLKPHELTSPTQQHLVRENQLQADSPRLTENAECFRDIDLERECISAASHGEHMEHTRWCRSMAGEEFARIHSWGNDPKRYV